ncbi:MAG: TonB-dependent receptor [Bacteroidales bacterium]|nr:TonB-dependent receptor [Bacteroidales bacterium]
MKQSFLKRAMLVALFAVLTVFTAAAQNKTITGTVVDSQGNPLIGATVMEKGTSNGAITDLDGNYSITVKANAILVFQCIGCATQELPASASPLNVTLGEDQEFLDEVVVVGYGVQKKSDLTGAISQVKSEDIENRTITSAAQALQGKTAGVQVLTNSAAPGASPSVRIRGISSNSSTSPLYVIDGRIGSIAGIDPNDIESMEVLKDAASAAIYGVAAGNGVILVTTRKGKGDGTISYDFQYTMQSLGKVPHMMNAEQWVEYFTEGGLLDMDKVNQCWDFKTNTDWTKEAFETSIMQRHNLSFSAGDEKGSVFMSGSYLDNNGMITGNNDVYSRLTYMINATRNIKSWLEVGTNNQIEYYKSRSVSEGSEYGSFLLSVLQLDPLTPVSYSVNNLPAYLQKIYDDPNMPELLGDGKGNVWAPSQFVTGENIHPFVSRDSGYSTSRGFNINGTTYINFKPFKGFVFTSRLGYMLNAGESYGYSNDYYYNAQKSNDILSVSASSSSSSYWQWENFMNYNKSFKGGHNINLMAGMSFTESRSFGVNGSVKGSGWNEDHTSFDSGFKKDDPLFLYFSQKTNSAIMSVGGGEEGLGRKLSYFGRVNYDYQGKYYFQASLRADAADLSVLPVTNRWGFFPAVSAGWTVSREDFMESTRSWLNQLKVRASWGQNGSTAGLGGYRYATVITSTGEYPTGQGLNYVPGYAPSATGNPELGWEKSEQTNIGLDARFLNDRLTLTADWFNKTTKDLIVSGITPSTVVGNSASPINAGHIMNTGFELELGWQDAIGDVHYGIRGNVATLKNKVTKLHETLDRMTGATFHTYGTITAFEVGHPAWYFYGYKFDKIDPITGTPLFVDINKDGEINDADKTEIGKGMADLTYGLTLNLAWKGLDFIVFGTGSYGNDIYCCLNRSDYILNKLTYFTEDRWTPSHTNATQPKAGANDMDKYMVSSASVFDGSYFKIKQMQLGYTLPSKLTKKVQISNLRIYASLDDWFTFTKYPGFDPEVNGGGSSLGVDKGNYPTSKKAVFGVSLKF